MNKHSNAPIRTGDLDVGLKMLAERKLDLTPFRGRQVNDIKGFFKNDPDENTPIR